MSDERERAPRPTPDAASEDKIQSGGRETNAAQPLNAGKDRGGPERYPPVDRTDMAQEPRSFDPSTDAPAPRQGAGDGSIPRSVNEGRLGPQGDPAEGKR